MQNSDPIFMTDDANVQATTFTDIFHNGLNVCAPLETRELRAFAPWIDDNLKALIQERNSIQNQLKNNRRNEQLCEIYKALKKKK